MIKILLHRVIWNGDKIRIHDVSGSYVGEFWVKIEGWGMGAAVRYGNRGSAIRRDLPTWSDRFGCWFYRYGAGE